MKKTVIPFLIFLLFFGVASQTIPFIITNKSLYKVSLLLYKIGFIGSVLLSPFAIFYALYKVTTKLGSVVPILILLVPVMTLCSNFLSNEIIEYNRNSTIKSYEKLISCIETHKVNNLEYPSELNEIKSCSADSLSRAKFACNTDIRYKKEGEGYRLSFNQKIFPLIKSHEYIVIFEHKYFRDKIWKGEHVIPEFSKKIELNNSTWYYYFWY